MLSRLRGKRLMFVGDSITRSQWESMVCMLQVAIPSNKKTLVYQSSLIIFKGLGKLLQHLVVCSIYMSGLASFFDFRLDCEVFLNCNISFFYKDYNASVEFSWDPFLVQQSTMGGKNIIQLDSVGENGAYWKGVDVLVFESSHWWLHAEGES